jgi:hypothetical protein
LTGNVGLERRVETELTSGEDSVQVDDASQIAGLELTTQGENSERSSRRIACWFHRQPRSKRISVVGFSFASAGTGELSPQGLIRLFR